MPITAKPLFRPEALRPKLAGFPVQVGAADPPEGKVAALWELGTGKLAHIFAHDGGVYFVAFLPGGHALTAGGTTVKRWDLETGRQVWSANAHGAWGVRAALSPDCR